MSDRGLKKLGLGLTANILLLSSSSAFMPANAEGQCGQCIDWSKLNLNQEQALKVQQCDQEWFKELQETQPEIQALQSKLKKLLASPKPEATEIMLVQQQLDSKKAKLKMKATQNILRKKEILDENQKKAFNNQMETEIVRRKQLGNGVDNTVQPVRWKRIWNDMQNVFNQQQ